MKKSDLSRSPSKPKLILLAGAALSLAGFAQSANAATSAFTLGGGSWSASNGNFVVGYEFSITTTISITHLGITDWYNNGISGTPQVGIWRRDTPYTTANTGTGTFLASVTMPDGIGADLVETQSNVTYYLEQLTTPLVIGPGNYVIANQHTQVASSQVFGWGGSVNFASGITYLRGVAENTGGASDTFPNDISYTAGNAYIGPQFKFDVVPEPSVALLGGLGVLALLRRRRD